MGVRQFRRMEKRFVDPGEKRLQQLAARVQP
jgi:hypothetical protein